MSDDQGGRGDVPSRADVRLVEQALRNDWPLPPDVKREILQTLVNLVAGDGGWDDLDDGSSDRVPDRTKIAAARAIAQFCGLTLKQQMLDLMRQKHEGKKGEDLADLVAKAEALAEQRERTREADRPAGQVP